MRNRTKQPDQITVKVLRAGVIATNIAVVLTLVGLSATGRGPVQAVAGDPKPVRQRAVPEKQALKTAHRGLRYDSFLDALWATESSGQLDPVPGDGGQSHGPYQIQAAYWQDGTEYLGVDWAYPAGAYDLPKARAVVRAYIQRYQGDYPETWETWARLHVAGPDGPMQECSLAYWKRFQKNIDRAQ